MAKAKVFFQVCLIGHRAYYKRRLLATISKHGSVRWEIPDDESNNLPGHVLAEVLGFGAEVARQSV